MKPNGVSVFVGVAGSITGIFGAMSTGIDSTAGGSDPTNPVAATFALLLLFVSAAHLLSELDR